MVMNSNSQLLPKQQQKAFFLLRLIHTNTKHTCILGCCCVCRQEFETTTMAYFQGERDENRCLCFYKLL